MMFETPKHVPKTEKRRSCAFKDKPVDIIIFIMQTVKSKHLAFNMFNSLELQPKKKYSLSASAKQIE